MSKIIEGKILDYIADRRGLATENDVIRYIGANLSRPTTLKFIDKLESDRKINIRRGRKGQSHSLSINDQSQFNRIKKQLSSLEIFNREINQYLKRRDEEIEEEKNKDVLLEEIKDKRIKEMNDRIWFVDGLYYNYYDTLKRILDDLFHVTTVSSLSEEDSQIFLKKIIELKSKMKYLPWSKDNEKKLLNTHMSNINNLIRKFERLGLVDYIEEKQIKNKFADPLKHKIIDFITQFLD